MKASSKIAVLVKEGRGAGQGRSHRLADTGPLAPMAKVKDLEIFQHEKSNRIYNIKIEDEILDKLQFSFNKFDLTALELKPFSRFTIAKSLDDLTQSNLAN